MAIFALFVGVLAVLLLVGLAYLLNGWAIMNLWNWFVVPLGAPAIGMAWAIGLATIFGLMGYAATKKKGEEDDTLSVWTLIFIRPLFAVFVGWLCHLAM